MPVGLGGPYRRTLWPIWADSSPCRPLSLYPLADKGLGPVRGPCRSTLWPIRRLATYRLADLGPFVVISALIALPFGQLPLLGPLSLYPLAVSALSCVPFVSVPCRAPLSSNPFQVFRLSRVPSGPRRGTSFRNLHFFMEMAPWRVQTSYLFRTLNFLRPPQGPRFPIPPCWLQLG